MDAEALFAQLAPSFAGSVTLTLNAPVTQARAQPGQQMYGLEISTLDSREPWLSCALAHEIEVLKSFFHATEPVQVNSPARLSETFEWKKFIDQQAINLLVYRLPRDRGEVISLYHAWLERNAKDFGLDTDTGSFFQQRAEALSKTPH